MINYTNTDTNIIYVASNKIQLKYRCFKALWEYSQIASKYSRATFGFMVVTNKYTR